MAIKKIIRIVVMQMLVNFDSDTELALSCLPFQSFSNLLELITFSFASGPPFDLVQINRNILPLAVMRNTGSPGKHHVDSLLAQMIADKSSEFDECHVCYINHSGFPFLLGRRRTMTSRSLSSGE
jgi:hypothetical protein